jgi:hydroxylamine reductase
MFCYQCEQTSRGTGCTIRGVCGKDARTAALQDLLIHAVKGLGQVSHRATRLGWSDPEVERFVIEALFTTITNVDFDPERIAPMIREAATLRDRVSAAWREAAAKTGTPTEELLGPAHFVPAHDIDGLVLQAESLGVSSRMAVEGPDVTGLKELVTYGLKGMAAYADHALILGKSDPKVFAFFYEALDFLTGSHSVEDLTTMALRTGEVNLTVMGLLDAANTDAYGNPVPTRVRVEPRAGKAIVVSGHDFPDLEALLKQTEGKGINVYTHGEMLPAHGYPGLHKYPHLVGNYGGAWQEQRKEFDAFPGAILMTTNCIQEPREGYKGRIFTSGLVAWPGVEHIANHDFRAVIEAALSALGFAEDGPDHEILVGFGHEAVLSVAGAVVDAVKSGALRHFFLVGGCDGAKPGRSYYTDFAKAVPDDCVILTLACGKYRFNKLDFGSIGGIPRLLDMGQCNDAYSAIKVASALAQAFHTDVNGLPLSMVLSWYEQKAVCILLSLLHLGVRNIRLGPTLPACVTPPVLDVLVKNFQIMPITNAEDDLGAILGA